MPERKKLDKKRLKRSRGLGAAPTPLPKGGRKAKLSTNFHIEWNRSTIIFYSAIIVIPYLTAIIVTARTGNIAMVGILIFVAMLVGLVYFVVRKIDEGGDF